MMKLTGPLHVMLRLSISGASAMGFFGQYWERNVDTLL
jgi:hypothetical protein